MKERRETEKKQRVPARYVLIFLLAALFAGVGGSFLLGRYPVPFREFAGIVAQKLFHCIDAPYWTPAMEAAVWNIRMPRVLLSVLVGAALSAAGAAYQGVFQNPIASPDILGSSAGSGFGAALAIYLGFGSLGVVLSAFVMSMVTVVLVFSISRHVKGTQLMGLILSGIIISSLFQSGTSFIKLVADPNNKLPLITYWLMGSLAGADWSDIRFVLPPVAAGMLPLFLLRWKINVLTMGDDEAQAMGVNPGRLRLAVIASATLLTAAAVSVSGMIGWIGLVIPHMMRRMVGSDYRNLMPACVLCGGLFLLLVDGISRNAAAVGIPLSILTSFAGAPLFLWLITGKGKGV